MVISIRQFNSFSSMLLLENYKGGGGILMNAPSYSAPL